MLVSNAAGLFAAEGNPSPSPDGRSGINRREFVRNLSLASGGFWTMLNWPAVANVGALQPSCPQSPRPARNMCALRLQELTTLAWDMRLTLSCLQGIVNRRRPELYLIHDRYDELWLNWLQERGDIDKVEWLTVRQAFDRFLPQVSCLFVTDPSIPATVNVATMLAGTYGGLVSTPETRKQYDLPVGSNPRLRKDGLDLGKMGWKKDLEAYRWAFQMLDEHLSRQAIAILDPSEVAFRDYLVEFTIPTFWISGSQDVAKYPAAQPEEEKEFARAIMMRWPPNIPCLGWPSGGYKETGIGENPGIRLSSECAKFEVCTAFDGYSPTVGNLSVHSGTSATLSQSIPPVQLQPDKVYCAFIRSDGDGMNFVRHYYRELFDDPSHGQVPLGWQLGPMVVDLMPDIADYYYQHARPGDCFRECADRCRLHLGRVLRERLPLRPATGDPARLPAAFGPLPAAHRRHGDVRGQRNASGSPQDLCRRRGDQGHLRKLRPQRPDHSTKCDERVRRAASLSQCYGFGIVAFRQSGFHNLLSAGNRAECGEGGQTVDPCAQARIPFCQPQQLAKGNGHACTNRE